MMTTSKHERQRQVAGRVVLGVLAGVGTIGALCCLPAWWAYPVVGTTVLAAVMTWEA
jgi:hypothetical protein